MNTASEKSVQEYNKPVLQRNGRPVHGLFTINSANMSKSEIKRALKEVDLTEWMPAVEHVNLSLNKKGRWKTIDKLTQKLQDGLYSDSDYAVHVIERVWLNNQANCKSLTSNKNGVKRNDTHLFSSESLLNGCKKNGGKRKRGKKSAENEHDVTPATGDAEIRIEVVRPVEKATAKLPVTTRRQRRRLEYRVSEVTAKRQRSNAVQNWTRNGPVDWADYVSVDWGDTGDWTATPVNTRASTKLQKPKPRPMKIKPQLPSLSWDSDCDIDFQEDTEDICDDEIIFLDDIKIKDFIVPASNDKRTASKKPEPRRIARNTKGKLEYIDKPCDSNTLLTQEGEISEQDLDPGLSRDKSSESPGVKVTLNKESISTEVLKDMFGMRYLECECRPRRFLLNLTGAIRDVPYWVLTPQVHARVKQRFRTFARGRGRRRRTVQVKSYGTHFQRERKQTALAGYLVFEEIGDGNFRVRCETDDVFNVAEWYEKVNSSRDWSPQSLADLLCDSLRERSEIRKPNEVTAARRSQFPLLQKFLEWPEVEHFFPSPFPTANAGEIQEFESHEVLESSSLPDVCGICCEDIDVTPDGFRSLTLTQCGHCFCLTCWKSHVTTAVRSGAMQIKCPEFECTTVIDQGTLACLLDIGQLRMLTSRLEDIDVQTSGAKVWCPRPGCGRILLSVTGSFSVGCVRCDCGTIFCVECGGNPHWPASCTDMERYELDLKRFGDDSVFSWSSGKTLNVQGKQCPKCRSFIEKRGGCPNMVCMCGHSFCWQCLQPWDKHSYNRDCYGKPDTDSTEALQEVYFKKIKRQPNSRSSSYMIALRTRMKLQSVEMKTLCINIFKMRKTLKDELKRFAMRQAEDVLMDSAWSRDAAHVFKVVQAIEEREGYCVLKWFKNVLFDICHVTEYGAVLVDCHNGDEQIGHAPRLISGLIFLAQQMQTVLHNGTRSNLFRVILKLNNLATLALKNLAELRAITSRFPRDRDF